MTYRALIFPVLLVTACGGADPALNTPADPEPEILLWTSTETGHRTVWLAPSGEGAQVVAEREGAFFARAGDLWRWVAEQRQAALFDCAELSETEDPSSLTPTAFTEITSAQLERVGSAERVVILDGTEPEGGEEHNQDLSLAGSIGPYLFVVESFGGFYCGAHSTNSSEFVLFDLSSGGRVQPLSSRLSVEEGGPLSGPLAAAITNLTESGSEGGDIDAAQVELTAVLPRYRAGQGMGAEYLFTAPSCYACGGHDWDSYRADTTVAGEALPALLAPHAPAPALVRAYEAEAAGTIGGWTIVEPEHREALRELFSQE